MKMLSQLISVRMVDKNNPKVKEKLITKCEGKWVEAGHDQYVGRTLAEIEWPEASRHPSSLRTLVGVCAIIIHVHVYDSISVF